MNKSSNAAFKDPLSPNPGALLKGEGDNLAVGAEGIFFSLRDVKFDLTCLLKMSQICECVCISSMRFDKADNKALCGQLALLVWLCINPKWLDKSIAPHHEW